MQMTARHRTAPWAGAAAGAALTLLLLVPAAGAQAQAATPTPQGTPAARAQGAPGSAPEVAARRAQRQERRDRFLDDVARRLNTTRDALRDAIAGAARDAVQARVGSGALTQQQADRLLERIERRREARFTGRIALGG